MLNLKINLKQKHKIKKGSLIRKIRKKENAIRLKREKTDERRA